MVIFVLLLINYFLVLFQYFYKILYFFFYKIWNSFFYKRFKSYLILDLNIFSPDWLSYGNLNFYDNSVTKLSFFKKFILSVFPDVNNKNYRYNNPSVSYLSNFRKNNFPTLDEIVENNFYKSHKISLKEFNKMGNFFLKKKTKNKINKNKGNLLINFLLKSFKKNNRYSFLHNLYIFLFFLENNFYYFITFKHFKDLSKRSFVKFNFLFLYILKKIKKNFFIKTYNLNKSGDWYSYVTDKFKFAGDSSKSSKNNTSDDTNTEEKYYEYNKFSQLNDFVIDSYKKVFNFNKNLNKIKKIFLTDLVFDFKNLNNKLVFLKPNALLVLNSWKINFSEASTNKHINLKNNFLKRSNFVFFYLRKSKIFNKGRYSRNRQTYRTGFYWCLWVNIFVIYGLHFTFYRFTFTFGYLWLFFIIFAGSFVFARMLKYNFHNYNYVMSEINHFSNWLGFLSNNFYNFFTKCILFALKNLNTSSVIWDFFFKFYLILKENLNSLDNTHTWYYLSLRDESFFKTSSKIFFFNQFFFKN